METLTQTSLITDSGVEPRFTTTPALLSETALLEIAAAKTFQRCTQEQNFSQPHINRLLVLEATEIVAAKASRVTFLRVQQAILNRFLGIASGSLSSPVDDI